MKTAYKILAFLVAALVVVQAAAIAFAISGLFTWVDEEGGVIDKAFLESDDAEFTGLVAFIIHGVNGMMLIPLVALILLIVAFFAKVPRGVMVAGVLLALVVLQVVLGLAHVPVAAGLHGLNALLIFGAALHAGMMASRSQRDTALAAARAEGAAEARATTTRGGQTATTDQR